MMRVPHAKQSLGMRVNVPSLREWWTLISKTVTAWLADYAPSMGAALSYYTVFSMAPTLLIVISVAGLVFGADAVRGEIIGQLSYLMGPEAAATVQQELASMHQPSHGVAGSIIGIILVLAGATSVFGELQNALDRIWHASARQSSGLLSLIRARLMSFAMILGIAFLLIVSLVMSAAISALGKWWAGAFGRWELLAQTVNALLGFVITMGSFAAIYRIIPRVTIHWTRRVARRLGDRAAVHAGPAPDWHLYRQDRHRFGVRGRRFAGDRVRVGVLLGADLSARRRVHARVRADLRFAARLGHGATSPDNSAPVLHRKI